jgi:membrane associated rhomboid family serine protease
MELNHILFFMAVASAGLIVLRSFRAHNLRMRVLGLTVVLISLTAALIARPIAGWIAASAWCALLLLPAYVQHREHIFPSYRRPRFHITVSPAVLTLMILNLTVFMIEIFAGGPENGQTLYRLGELDTDSVLMLHQYWRLLAALFLHAGFVHLFFNLFALLVIGPGLEREIGALAFVICYLSSGLASSAGIVLLTRLGFLQPSEVVGASGCLMGIVGTWAGVLLRDHASPQSMQRLRNIITIVLLQVAFDLVTPRVSMPAHLGGLLSGFILGLLLPGRSRHATRSG